MRKYKGITPVIQIVRMGSYFCASPKDVRTSVGDTLATMDDIDLTISKIVKSGYGRIHRHLPNTTQQRIRDMHIKPLLISIARNKEPGVLTDEDIKRYENQLDRSLSSSKEVIARLWIIRREIANRQLKRLKAHSGYTDVTHLARMLAPYIKGQGKKTFGRAQ